MFVVYWMIAARRTRWNFALDRAVEPSKQLGKPLASAAAKPELTELLLGAREFPSGLVSEGRRMLRSSPVVQAHIHFGASKTNGGVMVLLCGVIAAPTPRPASGTVTGTIAAADVGVLSDTNSDSVIPQGINPGDFAGLLEAI